MQQLCNLAVECLCQLRRALVRGVWQAPSSVKTYCIDRTSFSKDPACHLSLLADREPCICPSVHTHSYARSVSMKQPAILRGEHELREHRR